jgi:hypothetical protein
MVPLGLHRAQDILEVAALAAILLRRQHMSCAAGMAGAVLAVLIIRPHPVHTQ